MSYADAPRRFRPSALFVEEEDSVDTVDSVDSVSRNAVQPTQTPRFGQASVQPRFRPPAISVEEEEAVAVQPRFKPPALFVDEESKEAEVGVTLELSFVKNEQIISVNVNAQDFDELQLDYDFVQREDCVECSSYTDEYCESIGAMRTGGSQSTTWIGCPSMNRVHQELRFAAGSAKNIDKTVKQLRTPREVVVQNYVRIFTGYQMVVRRLHERPVPCVATIAQAWYEREDTSLGYRTLTDYLFKLNVHLAKSVPLAKRHRISQEQYFALVLQGLAALLGLWERGLYHNDVKARNMVFGQLTEDLQLRVLGMNFVIRARQSPISLTMIDFGYMTLDSPLDRYQRYDDSMRGSPPKIDICGLFASLQHRFTIAVDENGRTPDFHVCYHTSVELEEPQVSLLRLEDNTPEDNAAFLDELRHYLRSTCSSC